MGLNQLLCSYERHALPISYQPLKFNERENRTPLNTVYSGAHNHSAFSLHYSAHSILLFLSHLYLPPTRFELITLEPKSSVNTISPQGRAKLVPPMRFELITPELKSSVNTVSPRGHSSSKTHIIRKLLGTNR